MQPTLCFRFHLSILRILIAIASFSFATKRLIYINHTNLTDKDSPLKYMFTCLGVALAVVLTVAHILEYTLRNDGPDFSSALFHMHYCLQVSSSLSHKSLLNQTLAITSSVFKWQPWLFSGPGDRALPRISPRHVNHRFHPVHQYSRVPLPHLHFPGQVELVIN